MRHVLLFLCFALAACADPSKPYLNIEIITPERSARFPGIYVSCGGDRATLRSYVPTLGVNQLRGNGPNYISNKWPGCRTPITVAATSRVTGAGTAVSHDGFLVYINRVVQGNGVLYIAVPSARYVGVPDQYQPKPQPGWHQHSRPRKWDFGGDKVQPKRRHYGGPPPKRRPAECRRRPGPNATDGQRQVWPMVCG